MIDIEDRFVLSTASFCLWDIDIKEKLENCKKLGFKKVQIAMSTIKMLQDFCKNIHLIPQLNYFDEISLHAPWCGFKYGNNKKTLRVLELLEYIDNNILVDRYLFNYDSILSMDVLKVCDFNIIIRNPLIEGSWKNFKSNVESTDISCAFDLNKAFRSTNCLNTMITDIEKSVHQIHVSGFVEGQNRMPVLETKQDNLLKYISKFDTSRSLIVIEGLFKSSDLLSIDLERKLIMNYCR